MVVELGLQSATRARVHCSVARLLPATAQSNESIRNVESHSRWMGFCLLEFAVVSARTILSRQAEVGRANGLAVTRRGISGLCDLSTRQFPYYSKGFPLIDRRRIGLSLTYGSPSRYNCRSAAGSHHCRRSLGQVGVLFVNSGLLHAGQDIPGFNSYSRDQLRPYIDAWFRPYLVEQVLLSS